MIVIGTMENTTISVSKKFRDWLKSKGTKGESYEDIVKKMLKPEFLQDAGEPQASNEQMESM